MSTSLLRSRDFRLLAGAVGISALGDWLAAIPLILRVEEMTDSGIAVSGAPHLPVGAERGLRPGTSASSSTGSRRAGSSPCLARADGRRGRARVHRVAARHLRAHRGARRRLRDLAGVRVRARAGGLGQRRRPAGERLRRDVALCRLRRRSGRRRAAQRDGRVLGRDARQRRELRRRRVRLGRAADAAAPGTRRGRRRDARTRRRRPAVPRRCSRSR